MLPDAEDPIITIKNSNSEISHFLNLIKIDLRLCLHFIIVSHNFVLDQTVPKSPQQRYGLLSPDINVLYDLKHSFNTYLRRY